MKSRQPRLKYPISSAYAVCERAGRCQPERGVQLIKFKKSFFDVLDRAIRGFEDLIFSSPPLLRTFLFARGQEVICLNDTKHSTVRIYFTAKKRRMIDGEKIIYIRICN